LVNAALETPPAATEVEWRRAHEPVSYPDAIAFMDARVARIARGEAPDCVWLLEHPALYTAGTSATPSELIAPGGLPVFAAGRGGRHTYHGPGQRIAYVMLDLGPRGRDVRAFVRALEDWLIATLAEFGIEGFTREGRTGVWVDSARGEAKIAAIGVRVRRWVSLHGVSLNVAPDLAAYEGIVPCGIRDAGVTSMEGEGRGAPMAEVDRALRASFADTVGRLGQG
jgi:lipoyl(octanoyl) transferase